MSIVFFNQWRITKSTPWTAIATTDEGRNCQHRHFGDEAQAREWAKQADPSTRCRKVGTK